MVLEKGTKAPDFEGMTDRDEKMRLYDLLEKGPVVLYFYPKDETPGCVKEACTFRDNWDEISSLGAMVIGVSSDTVESHKKFVANRNLQFPMVSDQGGKIRVMYGAKGRLLPDRVTYVIETDGTILHVFKSQLNPASHAAEAIAVLKERNKNKSAE